MPISRRSVVAAGIAGTLLAPWRADAAPARVKKQVLCFYYRGRANPTFSDAWKSWPGPTGKEAPDQDSSPDTPLLGMYDSHDPKVLPQHALWLKQAGMTGIILGAWSREMWEDRDGGRKTLDAMQAKGLSMTVYLERQPKGLEGAKDDLRYLFEHGVSHPAWLHLNGRPVVFLYRGALRALPARQWREAAKAVAAEGHPEVILIGDVDAIDPAYADKSTGLDGTHSWSVVESVAGMTPPQMDAFIKDAYPKWKAKAAGTITCATVMPGWNDLLITKRAYPRPTTDRFGTETLAAFWRGAIDNKVDLVLVNDFNGFHNGAEIEPSKEWGDSALVTNAAFAERFLTRT